MTLEEKIKSAQKTLSEVFSDIQEKELTFRTYPKELPSFDELVYALGEIEIATTD